MVTLQTNYVNPGSIPAAINTSHADPAALSAGSTAAFNAINQIGNSFQNATHELNYMGSEEERADLRDQYRQQKAADKLQAQNDAIAQKDQNFQNKVYTSVSGLNAQTDLYKMMDIAKRSAQPGGDLAGTVMQQYQQMAASYIQGAPNQDAQQQVALQMLKMAPHIQNWGQNQQLSLDTNHAVTQISSLGQQASFLAQQDPDQVEAISSDIKNYGQMLKDQGLPGDKIDTHVNASVKAIYKNAVQAKADGDPTEALNYLQQPHVQAVLGDEPKFSQVLQKRIDNTITKEIGTAGDGLKTINDSILGGMQPPLNAADIMDQAHQTFMKYQGTPQDDRAKQLATDFQITNNLMQVQQHLVGSTPQELKQMQLGLYSAEKDLPGDPVTLKTTELTKRLMQNREALYKNSPLDVEQADGTIKSPTIPLDPSIAKDPQTLQQFVKERMDTYQTMAAKYGPTASPFNKDEIDQFSDKISQLDPVAKLNATSFLSNLPPQIANPISKKIADKDDHSNATGAAISLNNYDPKLAQDIVQGQAMMSGNDKLMSKLPTKEVQSKIFDSFGGLFQNDPTLLKQFVGAAQALTVKNAMATGGTPNPSDFQANLEKVAGIDRLRSDSGKYQTIMPFVPRTEAATPNDPTPQAGFRRMKADEFTSTVQGIKDTNTLAQYGNGLPVDGLHGKVIDPSQSKLTDFKWLPVSDGNYRLVVSGLGTDRTVMNQQGSPFIFNMKQYLTDTTGMNHG